MRVRLQKHARRPSNSPPPPAPVRCDKASAAGASAAQDTLKIPLSKIRILIGPGGSTVKAIHSKTGADVRVAEDGSVHICAGNADAVRRARDMIADLTLKELQVGEVYQATVVCIKDFGCFVEVPCGQQGLVHISELVNNKERIKVEDVVKVGDVLRVKCIEVDASGRARLSRKAALNELGGDSGGV